MIHDGSNGTVKVIAFCNEEGARATAAILYGITASLDRSVTEGAHRGD